MNISIGYLLAIIATVTWGLIVIPVKRTKIPGHMGIAISMPAGIITLLLASLFFKEEYTRIPNLLSLTGALLLLAGIFQFPLATMFYYESIKFGELSTVIPLTRIKSVFVVILVFLLGIEGISFKTLIACLVGVLGAIILTYHSKNTSGINRANMKKGIIFALLACLSWAIGDILIKSVVKTVPALFATLLSLSAGTFLYYLLMIYKKQIRHILNISLKEKMRFVTHGIFSFGIAYFAFFASIKHIGVTKATIITTAWPLISFIVGVALYREKMSFQKILGMLLIMGSVLLVINS